SVAIMYLDVDRFKIVNDSLGHSAGDALIVAVAERLRRYVRGCDTVSRMGGDEFVVLLADLQDRVDVRAVAEKLLSRFAEPFSVEGREIFLSASAGVSTYPADGDVVNELLEHADAAMYLAKERGRNNVQFYTADLHTFNTRKLSLEQDLRKGLERGEFVLHYQPIVAVPNGAVVGLEALVRWQHPASGLVMPGEFIPAAEESGLIVPLGEWVLATAIRQQRDFQHAGLACGRITVNISARQFQQRDFRHTIAALMREHGVQPGDLELELTESLVMRDVDASLRALHELSAMGVALSLDDFGTGYSSLNYLKRFPIDTIKIDRCFVSGVNGDAFDEAICQAIVTLSRSLHVRVVAEGVESQPQLAKLQRLGCDEAQGCLFSAAVPAAAAARLLSARTNRYA
ncbi:MAG TPA: EAL domain-containing protein, partial [Candidatus Eremiobacteraceae bacterium]|nr:EAL domain-containing protein [Candidatus Eremiobacteraceae bacterium]